MAREFVEYINAMLELIQGRLVARGEKSIFLGSDRDF